MRRYRPRSQAQTVAYPYKLPLVPVLGNRITTTPITKGPRLINCLAEKFTDQEYHIYKRPGLRALPSVYPAQYGRGVYYSAPTNSLVAAFGSGVYSDGALAGSVTPTTSVFFFEDVLTPTGYGVVMHDTFYGYVLDPATLTLTQITDVNFPSQICPGWAYLNGYLYCMDVFGNIWGSANTDDPFVWSSTNLIKASANADAGVALCKQLSYVVAFKQWTTQVFYDAGNPVPGSPLKLMPEAQTPYGCYAGQLVKQIGDSILWVTAGKDQMPQVARMDNLQTRIISTPDVDRLLAGLYDGAFVGGAVKLAAYALKVAGHRLYCLTNVVQNYTLVYDLDQELWSFWEDSVGNYFPIVSMTAVRGVVSNAGAAVYAQHFTNGKLYNFLPQDQQNTDDGVVYPVDIYTPNFDASTPRRKVVSALTVQADMTPGSTMLVRVSDDDFQSWSNFRPVDLSLSRPFLRDMGTFDTQRAHHFRHQVATTLRIKTVSLQLDFGSL